MSVHHSNWHSLYITLALKQLTELDNVNCSQYFFVLHCYQIINISTLQARSKKYQHWCRIFHEIIVHVTSLSSFHIPIMICRLMITAVFLIAIEYIYFFMYLNSVSRSKTMAEKKNYGWCISLCAHEKRISSEESPRKR